MIDTIHMYLPFNECGTNTVESLVDLSAIGNYQNFRNDSETLIYDHRGIRINRKENGIKLMGSLTKYRFGNNMSNLGFDDFYRSVEALSQDLHIPVHKASIRRLDISANLTTKYQPCAYYPDLLAMEPKHRMERQEKSNGIQFQNSVRTFLIYDKLRESKKSMNPRDFDIGLLRMELRLKSIGIAQDLGLGPLRVEDLFTPNSFNRLVSVWHNYYTKIKKRMTPKVDYSALTPSELMKYYAALYLQQEGAFESEISTINQLNSMGKYQNKMQPHRQKKRIMDLLGKGDYSEMNPLIKELDYKVEELVQSMMV